MPFFYNALKALLFNSIEDDRDVHPDWTEGSMVIPAK